MEKKNIITYRSADGERWQARTNHDMYDALRLGYVCGERASHFSKTHGWIYEGVLQSTQIPLHSIYEIKIG